MQPTKLLAAVKSPKSLASPAVDILYLSILADLEGVTPPECKAIPSLEGAPPTIYKSGFASSRTLKDPLNPA